MCKVRVDRPIPKIIPELNWSNYEIRKTYRKSINGGAALIGLTLLSQPAQAALITFTIDAGDNNLSSIVKNVDGVQLTLSDRDAPGNFRTDNDGVCVAGNSAFCNFSSTLGVLTSLNLTFNTQVQLISYDIGFNSASDFGLTFTQGSKVSNEGTDLGFSGSRAFNNQFLATANTPIVLTNLNSDQGGTLQIKSITVDTQPIPEPLTLLGATAAVGFGAAFKRRSDKAEQK